MKNSFQNLVKSLVFTALCCGAAAPAFGQLFKYSLSQTGSTVCVQAVPQFTDATACYHGGNAVLITPTAVSIESGDITNGLGTWSIVASSPFMGINFFQFGSETLSQNQSFTSGAAVTLFCVSIDAGECTSGMVRLMEQVNHTTPHGTDPDLGLFNAGVQHAVAASLTGNCSAESGTVFDGLTGTTGVSCLLLPVELVRFEASPRDGAIGLGWQSASETNFSGYELQRSTNGTGFSKIAWLPGRGGAFAADYAHEDADVRPGPTYYYRLKMLDLDGSFEFSEVRSAKIGGIALQEMQVSPNPAMGFFTVKFAVGSPGPGSLELVNEQGQQVYRQHYQFAEGENQLLVNAGRFAAGSYAVRVLTVDGLQTGKVVVGK